MRSSRDRRGRSGAAACVVSALLATAASAFVPGPARAADTHVRIDLEFLADGRCAITGSGESYRANLTYTPTTPGAPTAEFRCTIPSPPRGRAVELTVRLPRGAAPAPGDFPRFNWTSTDGRWTGTVSLPAAPAFVRVPEVASAGARRARWLDVSALIAIVLAVGWTLVYTARAAS